jgi:hypothetical protein
MRLLRSNLLPKLLVVLLKLLVLLVQPLVIRYGRVELGTLGTSGQEKRRQKREQQGAMP